MKPYQKLQEFWNETSLEVITKKIDETELVSFEQNNSIRFPPDFRDYLLHSCPVDDSDDFHYCNWWPLTEIVNVEKEYPEWQTIKNDEVLKNREKFLFFADYLAWCGAWAIGCDKNNFGKIVYIDGIEDSFVADSFSEFIDIYIQEFEHVVCGQKIHPDRVRFGSSLFKIFKKFYPK